LGTLLAVERIDRAAYVEILGDPDLFVYSL
jgi:hypothetical protein